MRLYRIVLLPLAIAIASLAGGAWMTQGQSTWMLHNHWLAPVLFIISIILAASILPIWWWDKYHGLPEVLDFPARNALNLKITNKSVKTGLGGVELRLHSLYKWNLERGEFRAVNGFVPVTLYADQIDLPIKVTRTFQLLRFTDPLLPAIYGKQHGEETNQPLDGHGTWKANLELLWGGGGMPIVKYFQWDENRLPYFCKLPR